MKIEDLLNKYFEGNTSAAEEKELRSFFASKDVPSNLEAYKPLFSYFDEEIAASTKTRSDSPRHNKRIVLFLLSGVAAAVLLILGIRGFYTAYETRHCAENYVVINGRCYTDIHKVRGMALEALKEVAAPAEEYFPEKTEQSLEKEMLEMQLDELRSLFNEE